MYNFVAKNCTHFVVTLYVLVTCMAVSYFVDKIVVKLQGKITFFSAGRYRSESKHWANVNIENKVASK